MVLPGQHPLSGCQRKEHVWTGSPLLCSSLPVHGPSCSSFKSCLQILVVSDCLQISSSEIYLVFFWTNWYLWSPQLLCQWDPQFYYLQFAIHKEALIFISFKLFSDSLIRNALPLATWKIAYSLSDIFIPYFINPEGIPTLCPLSSKLQVLIYLLSPCTDATLCYWSFLTEDSRIFPNSEQIYGQYFFWWG